MEKRFSMTFTGDLMCYPDMTAITAEKYGTGKEQFDCLFDEVRPILQNSGCLIGNLETPIADNMPPTHERYRFNTPVTYLDALKKCGFHLLTLATNHCFDRGEQGLVRTIDNVKARGIETVGAYRSMEERDSVCVAVFDTKSGDFRIESVKDGGKSDDTIRTAFVNYTYGINAFFNNHRTNEYNVNLLQPEEGSIGSLIPQDHTETLTERTWRLYYCKNEIFDNTVKPYLDKLKQDIQTAKSVADYVVMLPHFGGQYNAAPDLYTYYLAEKMREYGADIILGNHPHVIHSSLYTEGYFTAFSLGNFVYSPTIVGEKPYDPSYSVLPTLTLQKTADGIAAELTFRILHVVLNADKLPIVYDAYTLWQNESDAAKKEALGKTLLSYANRFADCDRFRQVTPQYRVF